MNVPLRNELLVHEFTRESERECGLYRIDERGIRELLHSFYPCLFRFDYFDETKFNVSEEGWNIKEKQSFKDDCSSYSVYAESMNGKGFNAGTHCWSIKFLMPENKEREEEVSSGCYHSIGVKADRNEDDIVKTGNHWRHCRHGTTGNHKSYYDGYAHWELNEVMTVKLDCDDWTAVYYKGKDQVQRDEIAPNQSYHFCVQLCTALDWTHLQIVGTPPM